VTAVPSSARRTTLAGPTDWTMPRSVVRSAAPAGETAASAAHAATDQDEDLHVRIVTRVR
jgi:hypothetical protein